MTKRLSISHGMVIPSPHGDGWKYTYFVHDGLRAEEHESDFEYANYPTAKQAMREYVEERRRLIDLAEWIGNGED